MILKRFYDTKLAQASYLIGCSATGEALVIDPNRNVEQYIAAAQSERVRVTHVSETHIHADFASGTRELAARTGAKIYLSGAGGPEWQYGFAQESNAILLQDGDGFTVGNIRIQVWHTPGHTPEHIIFFVTDGAAADRPIGIVTGDFVFVGDVGRPDLLEKAAKVAGTMDAAARDLYRSLQRFKELPDYLQIWPGHGAGSACGKGLSSIPHSTVGYERLFNWALQAPSEAAFTAEVLSGQPDPPRYFAEMKRLNQAGPRVLGSLPRPQQLDREQLQRVHESGATIVDTRLSHLFAAKHIPGTINIPLDGSFTTWAGWLIGYDQPFYLIVDDKRESAADAAAKAMTALISIGLDSVAGVVPASLLDEWARAGGALESVPQLRVQDAAEQLQAGQINIIDVRNPSEWNEGHLPGVPNIPLGHLLERLHEIPKDKPLVVQCQSGARSAIAASLLQARGYTQLSNLAGGFSEWSRTGQSIERAMERPVAAA